MSEPLVLGVSDFVAILNQTLTYAYPEVSIVGELANFKVSKGKWIYFDLKDDQASVRFFGTTYNLPGPLEDGMQLQVTGSPRLHQQFGFSVGVRAIRPIGEGTIKKAAALLKDKLQKEGIFEDARKRSIPRPPEAIGLVASKESAAFVDFTKVLGERWGGIEIVHVDVQVQGESAPTQIVEAIEALNTYNALDAIVVTRGGGSADDLQAFSTESVVRAVAGSRTPMLVAIGHEVDESLAELAADMRASTPSNAAELLVPDRREGIQGLQTKLANVPGLLERSIQQQQDVLRRNTIELKQRVLSSIDHQSHEIAMLRQTLHSYDPKRILSQGYAVIKQHEQRLRSVDSLAEGAEVTVRMVDGMFEATVKSIRHM